ncbi:MAG: hypothetical protein M1838_003324 [Thelocarpon superellum]|nr:MAG: hypothetical protein M1838_003324 [Thelocarpon superellum]
MSSDRTDIDSEPSPEAIEPSESPGVEKVQEKDQASRTERWETQAAERTFEPIRSEDRATLIRLASELEQTASNASGSNRLRPTVTPRSSNALERLNLQRIDTLAGVSLDDPVLDPSQPEFDVYKWARMLFRLASEEGIQTRHAGVIFRHLNVSGSGSALHLQSDVTSVLMAPLRPREFFRRGPEKQILRNFDGIVRSGELLVVLGRPGSGCSTLLKALTGEMKGLHLDPGTLIHYNGIPQQRMLKNFKGEVVYNQEVDKHFPHLTVGETIEFAATVRAPHRRLLHATRKQWTKHFSQVVMAVFGLTHTYNTKVGNDFVRGVSGGERKRVSIAEMAVAGSPLGAWDNSTRGLDAATALEFVKSLRMMANLGGSCHAVAIYQASQAIYEQFDKAIVLYEGREIFFGYAAAAKGYFEDMGWFCPARQTTGDFLTSVTNPVERRAREGYESRVPRTPDEFEKYWKNSSAYREVLQEMDDYEAEYPLGGDKTLFEFRDSRRAMQAKHVSPESPYTISLPMQVKACTKRAYQRLWNDKTSTVTTIVGQIVMALIVGSVFYNAPNTTAAFFQKGGVLFFAILLNALIAITEINALYAQRPIVEKHASYAFYHPFTEALAGIVADVPVKFAIAVCFNIILYFLAGLRQTPGAFFTFFLFAFVSIMTMSMVFRGIAASTKTISQALAIAGVTVLIIVIYTGFVIPRPLMHPWFKWLSWLNPIAYSFEALFVNEMHGRSFPCASLVPPYPGLTGDTFICGGVPGAQVGQMLVSGDAYLQASFQYSYSHIWRNLGILVAFLIFFLVVYLVATEFNSLSASSAEVLVFRRGHVPAYILHADTQGTTVDAETSPDATAGAGAQRAPSAEDAANAIPPQTEIFTWRNVEYDIQIQGQPRRLLDGVSGWVKPGTLTALMGVSGAGKTTLLDVLAQRTSIGVIHGDMLVSGKPLDASFQRKTGYVQQQDLHLETTTVREALRFSAALRQPKGVSRKEKDAFVEEVIKMLNMADFAEAVVGVPGEGLNVEQRKLLTIGVELAAKPALLLFLDEPTSGLDSQSSWAIIAFLRKLADHGQAVLSTIHQPSSILFQEFDRLLFLAKGGHTVYFGEIGDNSRTMLDYFERHGGRKCGDEENPAEYMLETVGAGASGKATMDWAEVWKGSEEYTAVQRELDRIQQDMGGKHVATDEDASAHSEFAVPFTTQLMEVTIRVFQQYWRTPAYIWAKLLLGVASALFIGFSFFQANSTEQGLQDVIFGIFMLCSILTTLIMPRFVTQRALYEVRERPSKAYSWAAFLIANIAVEIPYQILLGILVFASFYFPIFGAGQSPDRQGLILLLIVQFFVFASTYAQLCISALPDAQTAGNIATLMFSLSLTFNGVFQPPQALPGFWIFMYRVSPLTYFVDGIAATGLSGRPITCSSAELAVFQPLPGHTCGQYLQAYLSKAPGSLYNPNATSNCEYCTLSNTDQFLAGSAIEYSQRWRNYGIGFAYIIFNVVGATTLYYVFRVRKWGKN